MAYIIVRPPRANILNNYIIWVIFLYVLFPKFPNKHEIFFQFSRKQAMTRYPLSFEISKEMNMGCRKWEGWSRYWLRSCTPWCIFWCVAAFFLVISSSQCIRGGKFSNKYPVYTRQRLTLNVHCSLATVKKMMILRSAF